VHTRPHQSAHAHALPSEQTRGVPGVMQLIGFTEEGLPDSSAFPCDSRRGPPKSVKIDDFRRFSHFSPPKRLRSPAFPMPPPPRARRGSCAVGVQGCCCCKAAVHVRGVCKNSWHRAPASAAMRAGRPQQCRGWQCMCDSQPVGVVLSGALQQPGSLGVAHRPRGPRGVEQKLGGHRVCFGSMEKLHFLSTRDSLYSLLHSNGA
jgi:hypothetical protein